MEKNYFAFFKEQLNKFFNLPTLLANRNNKSHKKDISLKKKLMQSKRSLTKNIFIMAAICVMAGLLPAACITLQSKETRIIDAIQAGDNAVAEQLIQKTADLNYINEFDTFALLEASTAGNLGLVKLLVNNGADINLSNKSKTTALMEAIKKGHKPVVVWLIENKAELSLTNSQHYSALHIAVDLERRDIIEILLKHGAPTEYAGENSISVMTPAVLNDDIETVRFLLDKNVSPNATNTEIVPPLIVASKWSDIEMLKLLMDKGADIHTKNKDGRDALSSIGGFDKLSIIEKIYKESDSPMDTPDTNDTHAGNKKKKIHFKDAAYKKELMHDEQIGMKKKIKLLNDNGFLTVKASDQAIQSTSEKLKKDYIAAISMLLSRGADINTTDKIKRSVLILLCGQENTNIVTLFKDNGVHLESEVEHQLDLAIQKSQKIQNALTQALIDAKADIDLQDRFGQSALMAACSNNHRDFADILVKNGANVNQTNYDGWTPLINAVSMENFDLVELLLQHGATVNTANYYGETPLLKAVYRNNEKMVKLLLESGADVHMTNKTGDSPMSVAKNKGYANILALFADSK